MSLMGELKVRIKPDNLADVTKQIKKQFKDTGDTVENNFTKKTTKGASTIGNAFKKLKNTLASIFAVSAMLAFGKKLLGLGSDIEEFESKFKTVFGGVEELALKTFQTMGEAVGRSRTELIQFAGTVGDTLKPLGFASDEALVLSENMIKLAIDVASFNNVSDQQAINAFTKALTGEREALKSLGIVINETDVKKKAYTLGLAKEGQQLSKTAKALATYQLLLDNTTDAQGDAIKTADSFANQLKRVQGIIKDTFARAGRDIAKESAGTLKTIGLFIKTYGGAIFTLLVEIGKSIGVFFQEIGEAFSDVLEAVGINLADGQDKVGIFGNVLLAVLHALNIGIRGTGLILKSLIAIVVAVVQDMVEAFQGGVGIVISSFNMLGSAITTILSGVANNIIAKIQEGINGAITAINGMVQRLENLIGKDLFGDIGPVGSRNIVAFGAEVSDMFQGLQEQAGGFAEQFGSRTAEAFDSIKDDFLDLGAYVINQENKISGQVVAGASSIGDAYSTSFDQAGDLAKQFGIDAGSAGNKASKGAGKTKDAYKELQSELKQLDTTFSRFEKTREKAQQAQQRYLQEQQEYFRDLKRSIQEITTQLQTNSDVFDANRLNDIQSFARSEIEQQVALEQRIAETKQSLTDAQQEEEQNIERITSLKQELLALDKESQQVQENINQLQAGSGQDISGLLAEERRRAELSDAQQRAYDFQVEQDLQKKVFDEEQERLRKQQKIYELFQNYQFSSVEQLQALKNEKRLEELSLEEQDLINRLANERIALLQLRDEKLQLERQLARETTTLHNKVHTIASQNLASLDSKYSSLIRKIQQAISAQQRLNAVRASQRYKGGPVHAGQPYLVGENPDGTINPRTTELFIPNISGSVVPASQVQEALKQIHNIDNSRKAEISGPIYVQKEMDFLLLMERAFFRS